jgi:hypothetical protein
MELHPTEALLIQRIRNKYRYGRIEVILKDGLPIAVEKIVERESLYVHWEEVTMGE